ncbi:MAG: DUF975 family protein [Treponema sp.]|nr:DUF975 family protein [Treponema sp.]
MFDRSKYKDFAKKQLQSRWLVPVLMVLFTQFVFFFMDLPSFSGGLNSIDFNTFPTLDYASQVAAIEEAFTNPFYNIIELLKNMVAFVFEFACIGVYIKMSRSPEPVTFADYIENFSSWGRAILTGLRQVIFIFLWSLLFVIPGIIKYYSYSMMFYISAEFKDISVSKVMKLSKEITKGHKMDLFVLDLSFLGWFILTALTFGIAGFFVVPYYNMTRLNACHALLKEAVDKGIITMEDLRGSSNE